MKRRETRTMEMQGEALFGRRILIVGRGGSGKSTLARWLGERLGLPVIHLDQHYFDPDWQPIAPELWQERVAALAAGNRWVIEGNYSSTMAPRAARADLVIVLDRARLLCVLFVVARAWRGLGGQRLDAAPGCLERFDLGFFLFVWNWRPMRVMQSLQGFKGLRIHLRGRKAVRAFQAAIVAPAIQPPAD